MELATSRVDPNVAPLYHRLLSSLISKDSTSINEDFKFDGFGADAESKFSLPQLSLALSVVMMSQEWYQKDIRIIVMRKVTFGSFRDGDSSILMPNKKHVDVVCKKMLATKESSNMDAKRLATLSVSINFDEWLINIENEVDEELYGKMVIGNSKAMGLITTDDFGVGGVLTVLIKDFIMKAIAQWLISSSSEPDAHIICIDGVFDLSRAGHVEIFSRVGELGDFTVSAHSKPVIYPLPHKILDQGNWDSIKNSSTNFWCFILEDKDVVNEGVL